jgi:TetR/AcrR family transcriptional regulator, tetracycline repressor protein
VPLTRERILAVALRLVDEGGLAALSMRRLGAELGVDPMAVYRHLANKRAIVLALTEAVFATLPAPDPRLRWERRVRAWADAYRQLARRHPRLVLDIVGDPHAVAVAAVHANEPLYSAFLDAGLTPDDTARCTGILVDFVNGFVLAEAAADGRGSVAEPIRAELARRPAEQFPAQRRVLAEATADGSGFALGLDVLIAGIAARTRRR